MWAFMFLLEAVTLAWSPVRVPAYTNYSPVNSKYIFRSSLYVETSRRNVINTRQEADLQINSNSTILQKKRPKSKKAAMLWTLNSIENSDTDDVQLSTLKALREIVFANSTRQIIDAGKHLEALDLTHTESIGVRERVIKICALVGLMPLTSKLLDELLSECPSYIPNSISYIPVLSAYRKLGKVTKIEEHIEKISQCCQICNTEKGLPVQLDIYALNIYIGALCDYKQFGKAIDLLKEGMSMKKLGIAPDLVSFNTVLTSAVRKGNLNIANDVSKLIDYYNLERDIYTFNAQIRAAILSKKKSSAIEYIDQVLRSDIKPDQYFVDNAIIPLLESKRVADVIKLMKGLHITDSKQRSNVFSALLITLCKYERFLDDADLMFETFIINNSGKSEVIPTTRHFNVLLDGYRRAGRFMSASSLIKTMIRKNVRPDSYTLSTFMGCVDSSRALRKVWRYAVNNYDIPITPVVVTSYITELGRVGDVITACKVFDITYRQTGEKCLPMWNALIKTLTLKENSHLNIIFKSKVEPVQLTDTKEMSILPILNGTDTTTAAECILNFMRANKKSCPQPNSKTYCMVVSAYARSDRNENSPKALEFFKNAMESNVSVDGRFLNAVLRCFNSDIDGALSLWRGKILPALRTRHNGARGIKMMTRSSDIAAAYSGLMTVCGRSGRPDIAVRLTYSMSKDGVDPNETLLQCYEVGKSFRTKQLSHSGLEPKRIPLAGQFESILNVECTKYISTDSRRAKDRTIRIIL